MTAPIINDADDLAPCEPCCSRCRHPGEFARSMGPEKAPCIRCFKPTNGRIVRVTVTYAPRDVAAAEHDPAPLSEQAIAFAFGVFFWAQAEPNPSIDHLWSRIAVAVSVMEFGDYHPLRLRDAVAARVDLFEGQMRRLSGVPLKVLLAPLLRLPKE